MGCPGCGGGARAGECSEFLSFSLKAWMDGCDIVLFKTEVETDRQ